MKKSEEAVEVITLDLTEIKPHPKNPKSHWDVGIESSISERGYIELIVVDEKNQLIAGEGRWRALQNLGYKKVKVIRKSGLTEKQKLEYLLASNKLTERGGWNKDLLKQFEKDTLLLGGFESEEIEAIFDLNIQEDEFDEDKEYGKISEATTKRGDVFLLGNHKLMCGDSTITADVEKLMAGEKADMCWTDPPYNVNYSYDKYEAIDKGRKKKWAGGGKIFNDKLKPEDFYKFLLDVFKNINTFTKPEMAFYCCYATKSQEQFYGAFKDAGFHFSQTIIWMKERIILALGQDYHRVYEPIIFGWKEGEKHYKNKKITTEKEVWNLDKLNFEEQLDLWYLHRDKSSEYIHPTQKPARLPERAMKKSSKLGGLIYEPFNGSGSCMIGAEQLGRRVFAMELDPKYCDVAVTRWEKFTGKKAEKIG